ncbi:MAG TPA: hypothetical protein VKV39_08240 [Candidatus Sulfotelmatobacter sp.]|nr:hypothetical protein [Candidatus Sulfotelmatobacter sp.]
MPDWNELIRERLGCEAEGAVISELASHLEEVYEQARAQGLNQAASEERASQEVSDWRVLAAQIRRAKGGNFMKRRIRSFWLPALFTLVGSAGTLAAGLFFRLRPHLYVLRDYSLHGAGWQAEFFLHWWWLATLPIFGAMGAYLSLRADGTPWDRLAASLSPSLFVLTVMCVILAIGGSDLLQHLGFALGTVEWVVIPGIASLLGAMPLIFQSRPSKARAA